jgi:hypothetical protein
MSQPRTHEDLLRELQSLKEDSYTLAQRVRRLHTQACEALAAPKAIAEPTETPKTQQRAS